MTAEQAGRTSFREYQLRVEGHEQELRERWTLERWHIWQDILLSPYVKQGQKPRTPQAFWRFPWEQTEAEELRDKAEFYRVSEEEIAQLDIIFNSIISQTDGQDR